jgi:hypothetical protein
MLCIRLISRADNVTCHEKNLDQLRSDLRWAAKSSNHRVCFLFSLITNLASRMWRADTQDKEHPFSQSYLVGHLLSGGSRVESGGANSRDAFIDQTRPFVLSLALQFSISLPAVLSISSV